MTSIGSNIRLTRYLSPFWQRDFDEIKVLIRSNDPLFLSLNFEKDHLNKLLDAYNASLAYVDKDLHLVEHFLSDRTLEDTYGISGKLHYRTEHLRITKALIDIIFTHNHRIFISYNPSDALWHGERDKDIKAIRQVLVREFVPRLIRFVRLCKLGDVQQEEM